MTNKKYTFVLIGLIPVFALAGTGIGYFISTLYELPRIEQLYKMPLLLWKITDSTDIGVLI